MKLAKELGVRPQQIYGLIRKGRVNSWDNKAGKVVVGREEVTNALRNPLKRGPKTDKTTSYDVEGVGPPVKVGNVVTWRTQDGVRVAQVRSYEAPFNYMQDLWGKQLFFRNHSLKKRLEEGVAKIENPLELLSMLVFQFQKDGDSELAARLAEWVAMNRQELERGRLVESVVREPSGDAAAQGAGAHGSPEPVGAAS
jgi:hypothetical protein